MPRNQQLQHSAHDQELQHTDCGDGYKDPTYDYDEWGKIYENKGMKNGTQTSSLNQHVHKLPNHLKHAN